MANPLVLAVYPHYHGLDHSLCKGKLIGSNESACYSRRVLVSKYWYDQTESVSLPFRALDSTLRVQHSRMPLGASITLVD